jgi:uncharacterized protein YegJ (DUF2314 family)
MTDPRPNLPGESPRPLAPSDPADAAAALAAEGGTGWPPQEIFPTSLVAPIRGESPPTPQAVLEALGRAAGTRPAVLETIAPEDPEIRWNLVLAMDGLASPCIVWVEAARAIGPDDVPDPAIARLRWTIGFETLLGGRLDGTARAAEVFAEYVALLSLVTRAFPEVPAILDTATRRWFARDELERLFVGPGGEPEATEDVLWRVVAVGRSEHPDAEERLWLHTMGLARCGLPELEMLEVPGRHVRGAVTLLNGIAALCLTETLPPPAGVASVGVNLLVSFQPWQEVVRFLDPGALGSVADRRADEVPGSLNPLLGVRAVICGAEPKGQYRRIWCWPEESVASIERGEAGLYLSPAATRRLARRARHTWGEFATAFAALRARRAADHQGPAFLVKASVAGGADAEGAREHLWFEVKDIRGERAEGKLLNDPHLARHLALGEIVPVELDLVSDWRVDLPEGQFGPTTADRLLAAVDRFRSETA